MKYNAKEYPISYTHYIISKVLDGDSIMVRNPFTKQEQEIRLNGIDAPEIKKCAKLKQDERETHIAGQLLMHLGRLSWKFLLQVAPVATPCTIVTEEQNSTDVYGRTLAYIFLPDGRCLNQIMIEEGFAKPYNRFFCEALPTYQVLNFAAKQQEKGLYRFVKNF